MAGNRMQSSETDSELLGRFLANKDEAAFELLVRRHQRLVMGVCRRVLADEGDVDDAFQATFLVLAKCGGKIRKRQSISSWLYGVAYRVSLRAAKKRYRRREAPLDQPVVEAEYEPFDNVARRHEQRLISEELAGMPERIRAPLVMHYFGGQSGPQIANELGISVSAVEGRLKRGRKELANRLARRGISGLVVAALLANFSPSSVQASEPLITSVVQAASASVPSTFSLESASQLAREEVVEMAVISKKLIGFASITLALIAVASIGSIPLLQAQTNAGGAGESLELVAVQDGEAGQEEAVDASATVANENPFGETVAEMEGNSVDADEFTLAAAQKVHQANKKIELALSKETRADFTNIPLSEVADLYQEKHEFPIMLDAVELDAIGLGSDTPITFHVSGISLRSALKLMLEPYDLSYVIRDEVLMITTKEAAESKLTTRVYSEELFGTNGGPNEIVQLLQTIVSPSSWEALGGPGAISFVGDRIVVNSTIQVHQEIQDLIVTLQDSNQ